MKFDMSHEGVLSKRPFGQSEASRNRFRNDQMWSYAFSVVTTESVSEFHEVCYVAWEGSVEVTI